MARFRTVALGAALIAATAGAVGAQVPDSAKAGEWRERQVRERQGQVRPGARRNMERKMRAHHKGPMGPMGRGMRQGAQGRPGMPGMDLLRSLNLTETQRTQVRAIHEKYQPQMQAIHERGRTEFEATREARQRGDTAAVRAALQRSRQNVESQAAALHEQMFREVRAVLTADQRAKVDAQLGERIKRLDEQKARLERLRR